MLAKYITECERDGDEVSAIRVSGWIKSQAAGWTDPPADAEGTGLIPGLRGLLHLCDITLAELRKLI